MRNFFKRNKQKTLFEYQFLCKTCDIFFFANKITKNTCPVCHRHGELYHVREKKSN